MALLVCMTSVKGLSKISYLDLLHTCKISKKKFKILKVSKKNILEGEFDALVH